MIGITAEGLDAHRNVILPRDYTDAVARAGGIPVILLPWGSDAASTLARVDGLILAGGGDLDPAHYGGDARHPAVYEIDRERDLFEIELAQLSAERKIPLLGICRGLQVLNVALGGSLHEHLPDVAGSDVAHRGDPPGYVPHVVILDPASRLAFLLEQDVVSPLSWHHQAIDTPAPALALEAFADDGSIEGVELRGHPFFFGVQWHPEVTAAVDPAQQRLFDGLVRAADWRRDPERTPSLDLYWSFDKCAFPTRLP